MRNPFIVPGPIVAAVGVIVSNLSGCGGSVKVVAPPPPPPGIPVIVEYTADVRPMTAKKQVFHAAANEGLCVDVQGDNAAQHAPVRLFRCTGKENQRWNFGPGAGGAVQVGGIGGLCLSITGAPSAAGSNLELLTCNGSVAQEFKFFVDGRVRELGTNKCLTAGGGADHAGVALATCDVTNLAQVWTVADH